MKVDFLNNNTKFLVGQRDFTRFSHYVLVLALEDWIQIRGQLSSRLEYFPDDFDQTLTYIELPYYQYEFERKKRRIEEKRRSDGWLNNEVGFGSHSYLGPVGPVIVIISSFPWFLASTHLYLQVVFVLQSRLASFVEHLPNNKYSHPCNYSIRIFY